MVISTLFLSPEEDLRIKLSAMRQTELDLLTYARRYQDHPSVRLDVIDTRIPRSVLPLRKEMQETGSFFSLGEMCGTTANSSDQIYVEKSPNSSETEETSQTSQTTAATDTDGEELVVHAIRATSDLRRSASLGQAEQQHPPLVLLHGYANGALYFYRNIVGLSRHFFPAVYSLDLLGWGLSSRPPFRTVDNTVESAESFFVESLEAWRAANGIEMMILGGHSLGGYLGVAYCERYPERVERLLLLSPVGVPRHEDKNKTLNSRPPHVKLVFNVAQGLFECGTTPGSFLRSVPTRQGKILVEGYVERRLPSVCSCPNEKAAIVDYLYMNAVLPPSAEYCLNRLLTSTAHARKPAVYRIPYLKVRNVDFLYGSADWMDVGGGAQVERTCTDMRRRGEDSPEVAMLQVGNAGHLLMLDNWEEFNAAVVIACGGGEDLPFDAPKPSRFPSYAKENEIVTEAARYEETEVQTKLGASSSSNDQDGARRQQKSSASSGVLMGKEDLP